MPTFEPDELDAAERLFRLGDLGGAVRLAEAVAPGANARAAILVGRCLVVLGRVREAKTLLALTADRFKWDSSAYWLVRLHLAFLDVLTDNNPQTIMTTVDAALQWVGGRANESRTSASAKRMWALTLAQDIGWQPKGSNRFAEARDLLGQAVVEFTRAGDVDAALGAALDLGQVYLMETPSNSAAARRTFEKVEADAATALKTLRQAEATVALASLDLVDTAAGHHGGDNDISDARYRHAEGLYLAAGHLFASAIIQCERGTTRVSIGLDGSVDLQAAMAGLGQYGDAPRVTRCLLGLAQWELSRSRSVQAEKCYRAVLGIWDQRDNPATVAIARMGLGEAYQLVGDYERALAEMELAVGLTRPPIRRAQMSNVIALASSLARRPGAAVSAGRAAADALRPFGPTPLLSHALFSLAIILGELPDWDGTLGILRECLECDVRRGDSMSEARDRQWLGVKLVGKARASLPAAIIGPAGAGALASESVQTAYLAAMMEFEAAAAALDRHTGPTGVAVAGLLRARADTAIAAGRPADAIAFAADARTAYEGAGMSTEAAYATLQIGLFQYNLGQLGDSSQYAASATSLRAALDHFLLAGMNDVTWRARNMLAQACFRSSLHENDDGRRRDLLAEADRRLQEAATDVEFIRGRAVLPDPIVGMDARLGMGDTIRDLYTFAVEFYLRFQMPRVAFEWVERAKSRSLLDVLATADLHPPAGVGNDLLADEARILAALRLENNQAHALRFSDQLHALWDRMSVAGPAAAEYADLRRGRAATWAAVAGMLATDVLDSKPPPALTRVVMASDVEDSEVPVSEW